MKIRLRLRLFVFRLGLDFLLFFLVTLALGGVGLDGNG